MSGATPARILVGHILPNTLGPVIVYATLTVPAVILEESFLAFIGLSVQMDGQSLDSWGTLVKEGVEAFGSQGERSWLFIAPAVAMVAALLGLNLLGDGLRDWLDPRQGDRA